MELGKWRSGKSTRYSSHVLRALQTQHIEGPGARVSSHVLAAERSSALARAHDTCEYTNPALPRSLPHSRRVAKLTAIVRANRYAQRSLSGSPSGF